MKKVIVSIVGIMFCVGAMTLNAAPAEKAGKLTPEQIAERKALIEKYDANKDGKLDKGEKAAMSKEDKEKLAKLQGAPKKEKAK